MHPKTAPQYLEFIPELWSEALADTDFQGASLVESLLERRQGSGEAVTVQVWGDAESGWRLGVGMPDGVGVLSVVSGLLTSAGLDIVRADTVTVADVRSPVPESPRRAQFGRSAVARRARPRRQRATNGHGRMLGAVMLFELESHTGQMPDWEGVERDIAEIARLSAAGKISEARADVIERFASAMRDTGQIPNVRQSPDISIGTDTSGRYTLLTIRAGDAPGFLFALTNALTSVGVNVVRARARTAGSDAQDTFWLTDRSGAKIESETRIHKIRLAAALIKQFTHLLPVAPDPGQALRQFDALTAHLLSRPDWTSEMRHLESPGVLRALAEMMGVSRFLWEDFLRMQHDNLFPVLLDLGEMDVSRSKRDMSIALGSELEACSDHIARVRALNDFKDREMFRSDLRYITGSIDWKDFGSELTDLADSIVEEGLKLAMDALRERYGTPRLANGLACGWAAFALGKFGGTEMGFGSDIELLFVYEEEGRTDGTDSVRTSSFFGDAIRGFIGILNTRQSRIFDVDMRLRPYGSKGALASSFSAVEGYYRLLGDAQQFERMALVRMRPIAGDERLIERVMAVRESFVFSDEPLDLEDVRHLRQRQWHELVGHGKVNAKLSPGGVVDIEYYIQALQIANGHRDRSLRVANTMDAVDSLYAAGYIPDSLVYSVRNAYGFLRVLIDALRVVRGDAKDLDIPPSNSREFMYLAHRLSIPTAELLDAKIADSMDVAHRLWEEFPPRQRA